MCNCEHFSLEYVDQTIANQENMYEIYAICISTVTIDVSKSSGYNYFLAS